MTTESSSRAWAIGGLIFAATMMIMLGIWQVFIGIAALANDEFFVVGRDYTYNIDTTAWGWIHLGLGALAVVAGFFLYTGAIWARAVGIALAALAAINNFIFLPYYPLWSLVVIGLAVFVIWSLGTARALPAEDLPESEMAGYYGRGGEPRPAPDRWPTNRPSAARTDAPASGAAPAAAEEEASHRTPAGPGNTP